MKRILSRIPWKTNLHLLEKLDDAETRLWYAQKALEHGLGKNMIVFWIEWKMHLREDKTLKKRVQKLPPLKSDMAEQSAKDAYVFDYFGNAKHIRHKELKYQLSEHIRNYLMQSGQGLALVGEKVHIELGGSDYYIDQLYYHTKKKCYVVVELQAEKFDPGHTSVLHLKVNVVSESLKQEDDNATIGMLLVKSKSQTLVEYSIKGSKNNIGVASWRDDIEKPLLPDELQYYLPSVEEIERELGEF